VNNKLGIGTSSPGAQLTVGSPLGGAASSTFTTNSGNLGSGAGSEMKLASFGCTSANNLSLALSAYRNWNDNSWSSSSLILGMDVDNTTRAGGAFISLSANGNIGIGTANASAKLEVNGSSSYRYDRKSYLDDNGANGGDYNGLTRNVSILASNDVVADEFGNTSDVRIKKDLKVTDSVLDLDLIMGLEVTDYRFKDTLGKGTRPQKKLIAQQVEVVFPQAVSRMVGVVPDIYQRADVKDGWVELATDLKAGDRVRLIGQKEEAVHGVLEVRAGAFRPDGKVDAESLFVYGREVQDFRTVDYDAIAMLNVSATQELAKQLKEKDAKITAMAAKLAEQAQRAAAQGAEAAAEKTALQAQIAALQASGQTLEAKQTEQNAKLAALERLVTQQLEATPHVAAKNVVLQRAK